MATNITQTTLSASFNQNASFMSLTSTANIVGPTNGYLQKIYVIDPDQTKGTLYAVTGAPNGSQVPVVCLDEFKCSHSSSTVLIAPADPTIAGFQITDPVGNPSVAGTYPGSPVVTPWLNVTNGYQWLQAPDGHWVPGWNNPTSIKGPTAAVASAAGVIIPSGPLFHVTGTAAITGFGLPLGFAGGSFTIIPDAVFTWTAATDITLAGTAVVNKALTFTYDSTTFKFSPSYIA